MLLIFRFYYRLFRKQKLCRNKFYFLYSASIFTIHIRPIGQLLKYISVSTLNVNIWISFSLYYLNEYTYIVPVYMLIINCGSYIKCIVIYIYICIKVCFNYENLYPTYKSNYKYLYIMKNKLIFFARFLWCIV